MRRKWIFVVILFACKSYNVHAQLDFGISMGISTMDVEAKHLTFLINDRDEFVLKTQEARYGIQLGAFAIVQFNKFYIMPEAVFHSQKFEHHLNELNSGGEAFEIIRSEKLTTMDLSLMMGYKLLFLRFGVGPVARLHIDNVSQLWAENGYDQSFKNALWGGQAGVGLDILMVHLDIRYQFDFTEFGNHITFFGQQAKLSSHAGIWSVRVGWSF